MAQRKSHHTRTLSPEMALFGQLFSAPGHGYDLHRKVVADLGEVWHLSQSQAYAILKRLEMHGDITSEQILQEKLPDRQHWHMTPKGRQRFLDWLEAPSGSSTRAIRMEFVTRLYFLEQFFPEKLDQAFKTQKAETESHIANLAQRCAALPRDQVYNRISLNLRIQQLKSVLAWLDECRAIFQQR